MTAAIDPAIQQRYDQSTAARRSGLTEVTGELTARQAEVAEQIKKDEESFAALTKRLTGSTPDEPPAPARRPEDNDISASASAYQEEPDEEPAALPAPAAPQRPARPAVDEEEVPSFQWDEDSPAETAAPPPPPQPAPPPKRQRPPRDEDEDLSDRDWFE